jgi:hypothetical protein
MLRTPEKLTVEKLSSLKPGDLFFLEEHDIKAIGLTCSVSGKPKTLWLGPLFTQYAKGPELREIRETEMAVVSFGNDFSIRLPVEPQHWSYTEPENHCHCLLVAGTGVYVRANGKHPAPYEPKSHFLRCFANVETGIVEVGETGEYSQPRGTPAYALTWERATAETEPRAVLRYSVASEHRR